MWKGQPYLAQFFYCMVGSTVLTAVGEFTIWAAASVAVEVPTSHQFWWLILMGCHVRMIRSYVGCPLVTALCPPVIVGTKGIVVGIVVCGTTMLARPTC